MSCSGSSPGATVSLRRRARARARAVGVGRGRRGRSRAGAHLDRDLPPPVRGPKHEACRDRRARSRTASWSARVVSLSPDVDLALLEVEAADIPVAALKPDAQLGRRGVGRGVSPRAPGHPRRRRRQPARPGWRRRGRRGDGRRSGQLRRQRRRRLRSRRPDTLVGIVEGYRTARVKVTGVARAHRRHPVPGETTVVSARGIRRFLDTVDGSRSRPAP